MSYTTAEAGNTNGPLAANRFLSLVDESDDADFNVTETKGWSWIAMYGLTANRIVLLPATPTTGQVVIVDNKDGTLATFDIIINGNGLDVQGAPTYTMSAAQNGAFGAVCLQYDGTGWYIFAEFSPNATGAVTLTGNTNGPSGTNRFLALNIIAPNTDAAVNDTEGWYQVTFEALTAGHTVTLPVAPTLGMVVVVTDGDGSLATENITIAGNGNNVQGAASYVMTAAQNGARGSVALIYQNFLGWVIWAQNSVNATGTLVGNVNGPLGANRFLSIVHDVADANFPVTETEGWIFVGMQGLSASRTVTLPAAPTAGMVVIVTDQTDSLESHNIVVSGNGKNVQGSPTYTVTGVVNGFGGSVVLQYDGAAWYILAAYTPGITAQAFSATGTILPTSQDILVFVNTSAGPITLTLPVPTSVQPREGFRVTIKDVTGSFNTNPCTLETPSGTIEGSGDPFPINASWAKIILISDGTNYYV